MGKKISATVFMIMMLWLPAFAGGYPETYGVGIRALALGGAFTAVADDFAAVYYNPAGLSQLHGHELQIGALYTRPDISVDTLSGGNLLIPETVAGGTRNNPSRAASKSIMLPQVGARLDINRIVNLPVHTELGISVCFPENFDVAFRVNDYPPDQPHFFRYGANIEHLTIIAGLGLELIEHLAHIGVGVQTMLHGPGSNYFDKVSLSSDNQNVVGQTESGALLEYDPIVGLYLTPFDKVKLGLSWKKSQECNIGPEPIRIYDDIGNLTLTIPLTIDVTCFYRPEEWSAGVAYDGEAFLVSLQVDKQFWSDFKLSGTDLYHYSEPDFDDTLNLRLGVEYKLSKSTSLMAGFCRQPSPVPNQDGSISNYLDADKNIFSAGASLCFKDTLFGFVKQPMKLTGVLVYQQLEDFTVNKDGVTGISWVDQESYEVKGDVLAAGLSLSFTW